MTRISSFLLLASLAIAPPVAAQDGPRPARPAPPARPTPPARALVQVGDDANAQETQNHLRELMQQYPPSLAQVMSIDPTLSTNQVYLEPYPALAAFLSQHPEIAHNPRYFFGEFRERNYDYNDPKVQVIRAIDQTLAGVGFLIGFLTVILTIAWLLRAIIEHRKWQRVSKTHVDTHTRLMERLTSNEDLLAYMQSPAGRRFLEAAPIPVDGGPRMLGAPFGRILWSVQAGVVIAFLGGGLIYASHRIATNAMFSDGELPIFVVGAAMMAIGAGFFVSAIAAYGLSRRLGLLQSPADPGTGSGATS